MIKSEHVFNFSYIFWVVFILENLISADKDDNTVNLSTLQHTVLYSVMQSDENSKSGDVVLNSFNRAFWVEYNILDQIYKNKYVRTILMMILILYNIIQNSF